MNEIGKVERRRADLVKIITKLDLLDYNIISRSYNILRAYRNLKPIRVDKRKFFVCILIVASSIFYRFIYDFFRSVPSTKCLIEQSSSIRHVFRPLVDCSMCLDVDRIDKIDNVKPAEFEKRYAYSGRPVVVTDATSNWTATKSFSFAFFKKLYQHHEQADCHFFPYKTEFSSLKEVLAMEPNRADIKAGTKPWYVGWSNCDEIIGSVLRKHYDRPYFLPETAESEKTDWIFMGSPGYGAPMHLDEVHYPSWQAQIRGRKTWFLEPPRECHYKCKRLQVTVEPGEIIVLDTNKWYHQTLILDGDMSITIGAEFD